MYWVFLIFLQKEEPRSAYGCSRITRHRCLPDGVREIEIEKRTATIAIIGPPDGGEDSNIEIRDENHTRDTAWLPDVIDGEVDVFY